MNIEKHVETLRSLVSEHGDYRNLASKSGVSYHWLQKFSIGVITNPTVENVAKLETYFAEKKDAA